MGGWRGCMCWGREREAAVTGTAIGGCLNRILDPCAKAEVHLGYPGGGGERPFRHWPVTSFLTDLLGWPADKVVVNENAWKLMQTIMR